MNRNIGLLSLSSLVLLVAASSVLNNVSAIEYQRYQRIDFTFNPSIEINLSSDGLFVADLMPGEYSDSNIISITSSTNVPSGLVLSATVGRDDSATHDEPGYVDPYNTTDLVNLANIDSSHTINRSSFSSINHNISDLYNFGDNEWGYSYCIAGEWACINYSDYWVSGNSGETSSGYNGLPLHGNTGVALVDDNSASDNTVYFKIGAKASNTQISGSYSNIVNFSATSKVVTTEYEVIFNGQNNATDWPYNQSGSISEDIAVPLGSGNDYDSAPVRAGYNFLGWCTVFTDNDTCSGNVYLADEAYPVDNVGGEVVVNLYAIWKTDSVSFDRAYANAGKQKLNNYYKMQDMSTSICNAITEGEESQLIDIRDNKVYYVAKLADDRCWMTQNLDHDISTETEHYTYANTDIGHGSTINTSAKWTAPDNVGTWSDTTTDRTIPRYADPDDFCWDGTPDSTEPDPCGQIGHHYHLGNYYNWTAAIAMSDSSSYSGSVVDVDQSICPAGWTLPRGGAATAATNDFVNLLSQPEYGWSSSTSTLGENKTMWGEPLYFALGGFWNGSLNFVGSNGTYWSSTVFLSDLAYRLYFTSGGYVYPDDSSYRDLGFPIRCVVRPQ